MIDLTEYRENAEHHQLCVEYKKKWDACRSKKEVIDMALSGGAAPYLCKSICEGWGISPKNIKENFVPFINGRYLSVQKGYTSRMYCCYSGNIIADATMIVVIDGNMGIEIPASHICEIHCTGKCTITLIANGKAKVVCYGDNVNIDIKGTKDNIKKIHYHKNNG